MRFFAIFLCICVLVASALLLYQSLNTQLVVVGQRGDISLANAPQNAQDFYALQLAMERENVLGTVFTDDSLEKAEDYSFQVYTISLKNNGLLPAEMVGIQCSPYQGDILSYTQQTETMIAPGKITDVWIKVLTKSKKSHAQELFITYYLLGKSYTMRHTINTNAIHIGGQ